MIITIRKVTRLISIMVHVLLVVILSHPADAMAGYTELPKGTSGCRVYISRATAGSDPVIIGDDIENLDIAPQLTYLFDITRRLKPADLFNSEDFKPTNGRVAWGHRDAAGWFRFSYVSRVTKPKDLNLKVLITGFPWTVNPGERGTVLIFLDYSAGILSHARIYSSEKYKMASDRRLILIGLLLGMNIALLLYNIFIYIWTREFSFLAFVLFMASFTMHVYLREDYITSLFPRLHDHYFGMPAIAFAILFFQSFLETRKNAKGVYIFYNIMLVFSVFFTFSAIFLIYRFAILQMIQAYFQMFLMVSAFLISLYLYIRRRIGSALFFFLSFLPLMVTNVTIQLEMLGVLQTDTPLTYFAVREGLYAAGAFQAVLLSIVLANKINIFKSKAVMARKEKQQLELIDRAKTSFIMNVSHELRTPLTLILGTIDNIMSGKNGKSVPCGYRGFQVVKRNASRLLFMINNLLDITRLEFRKSTLHMEHILLDQYLRFIWSTFDSLAQSRSINFSYEKRRPDHPVVAADLSLLETALLNLLSNAFKFTSSGDSIRIVLDGDAQMARIQVRDTGPGIPVQETDDIFNRFFQVESDRNRKYEGTGIGLSLAKEAITAIGGRIQADNSPSGGAVFTVWLPLSTETATNRTREFNQAALNVVKDSFPPILNAADLPVADASRPTILIVEDNTDLLAFLSEELQDSFVIVSAQDGIVALDYLRQGTTPHLIICDVMMPKMDGFQLFNEIRRSGFANIPFLFLTARVSETEKLKALESGASDYIFKPFSPQELRLKVQSMIKQDEELSRSVNHQLKDKIIQLFDEVSEDVFSNGNGSDKEVGLDQFADRFRLSPREKQITFWVLTGKQDKEIASELNIAISTVSNTLSRVYKKTDVSGRVGLIKKINESV